jgi:hypothetical protein
MAMLSQQDQGPIQYPNANVMAAQANAAVQAKANANASGQYIAPKRASVPYRASAPAYSSGGGSSYSSGSSYVAPAPAPPPMSINDWLGQDTTYQAQQAAINKALGDYRAQMADKQTRYGTDYAARTNDLNINKQDSQVAQANDFASRGLYQSGLYGQDVSKLLGDFARRQADMSTAKANYEAGLQQDLGNYTTEQNLTGTEAKQNAINRRASKYGL